MHVARGATLSRGKAGARPTSRAVTIAWGEHSRTAVPTASRRALYWCPCTRNRSIWLGWSSYNPRSTGESQQGQSGGV